MVARHVIIPFLPPPEEGAENTIERAGSWGDPGYATEALTAAGFTDAAVEERNLDIDLPADTDIPASLLTGVVDQAHRDAVLEAWQSYMGLRHRSGVNHATRDSQ